MNCLVSHRQIVLVALLSSICAVCAHAAENRNLSVTGSCAAIAATIRVRAMTASITASISITARLMASRHISKSPRASRSRWGKVTLRFALGFTRKRNSTISSAT